MRRRKRAERPREERLGLTLIELTLALTLVALITATAVMSVNAITDAYLRSAAIELAGVVKYNYDRAAMLHRTQRLVMDIDNDTWWIEFSESRYALSKERVQGEEGKRPEEEKEEEEEDRREFDSRRFAFEDGTSELMKLFELGSTRGFVPDVDAEAGKPRPLPSGVHFARIWTGHQEEPFRSGVAYLHFFPRGWTEPAIIELEDDEEDVVSLKVQPLTGRVRTYQESLEKPEIEEDDGREEGDL